MTQAVSRNRRTKPLEIDAVTAPALAVADLVLLRVAAAPATRADLQRDLLALTAPGKASGPAGVAFRRAAETAIGAHITQGLMAESKGRLQAFEAGRAAAARLLPGASAARGGWDDMRRALVVRALGLTRASPQILKATERLEGLAALVLQAHFELTADRAMSPNDLRAALAVVALERAFGDKIKTGLGKGSGLPGKAGRLLAGQLFAKPRAFSSDGKLIVALAAEVAGSAEATIESLTLAVLRNLTAASDRAIQSDVALAPKRPTPSPAPANDALPIAAPPLPTRRIEPPEMREFASAVLQAARPAAQGWPGARKAFISLVWQAIRNARPDWGLTEIAFKSMLAEAHRTGEIVLASADLKDRCDLRALEESRIVYKNTVWHFVRVED
ncbi:MAG: hypothetical protein ACKVP4_00415 [Hyphomicrobium sp.]